MLCADIDCALCSLDITGCADSLIGMLCKLKGPKNAAVKALLFPESVAGPPASTVAFWTSIEWVGYFIVDAANKHFKEVRSRIAERARKAAALAALDEIDTSDMAAADKSAHVVAQMLAQVENADVLAKPVCDRLLLKPVMSTFDIPLT